jgi:hypothetical protein
MRESGGTQRLYERSPSATHRYSLMFMDESPAAIHLYWIPLGAGGVGFIRFNGRVYEAIKARSERRRPLDLYHTALRVMTAEGTFVVENAWPSPDSNTAARGVVVEGPVFAHRLGRLRPLRYEVRRWRDGVIADLSEAVGDPMVSDDPVQAGRLIELVEEIPPMVWGRDEVGAGEMWNSNSVISWLLAGAGIDMDSIAPPAGGRAPGWRAGLLLAGVATKDTG